MHAHAFRFQTFLFRSQLTATSHTHTHTDPIVPSSSDAATTAIAGFVRYFITIRPSLCKVVLHPPLGQIFISFLLHLTVPVFCILDYGC